MRLLIATPLYPPDVGGPARYAQELEKEWLRLGHTVTVVPYGWLERKLPVGLRHVVYTFRLLPSSFRATAIIALDTWSVGLPALACSFVSGKKLLIRIGGDALWESYVGRTKELIRLSDFYSGSHYLTLKERFMKSAIRYLCSHADMLLFNTEWQRDRWSVVYGYSLEKTRVVENVIPERMYGTRIPGTRIFAAAGRSHPLKNAALLERVFRRVKSDFPDIELDARSLPLAAHEKRVHEAYAVVIASVSEVNPNTAIDAVVAGIPFIAPQDSGATDELRGAGIFIDTLDEVEMERALRRLLNPNNYDEEQQRVRAYARVRPWREVADEVLSAIQETITS